MHLQGVMCTAGTSSSSEVGRCLACSWLQVDCSQEVVAVEVHAAVACVLAYEAQVLLAATPAYATNNTTVINQ
jgi:hypothetical protein